jgi:hypothetical protein
VDILKIAYKLNVDPKLYVDESNDADDVEQCTTSWCLDQITGRQKSSSDMFIITDVNIIDWFVLVVRTNGPGRSTSQAAWSDRFNGFTTTGKLESDTIFSIVSNAETPRIQRRLVKLPVIISNDWDPSAKFVDGMENESLLHHFIFCVVSLEVTG